MSYNGTNVPFFMHKILLSLAGAMALSIPVHANPDGVRYNSLDSLGCLMLRECTEDVTQVKTLDDVKNHFEDSTFDVNAEELTGLFDALGRSGVDVFIADETYFPANHRGIYDVKSNSFFLNDYFVWDERHLIGVMRHEGWHVAQDCMAGTLDNTFTAVILQDGVVPQFYIDQVARTYPPKPRPWENEAFYAGATPNLTLAAVNACASETPMWEIYEPTPLTREWLVNEGFIK